MYVSKLKIKNYRSIKELDLEFKKGKNVIVGKNNAGKSNIGNTTTEVQVAPVTDVFSKKSYLNTPSKPQIKKVSKLYLT